MARSLKEESRRRDYTTAKDGFPGVDLINMASLQRIADATEAMANYHVQILKDLEWYRDRCRALQAEVETLKNSRAGYKAALAKLRKKHA